MWTPFGERTGEGTGEGGHFLNVGPSESHPPSIRSRTETRSSAVCGDLDPQNSNLGMGYCQDIWGKFPVSWALWQERKTTYRPARLILSNTRGNNRICFNHYTLPTSTVLQKVEINIRGPLTLKDLWTSRMGGVDLLRWLESAAYIFLQQLLPPQRDVSGVSMTL